MHKTANVLNELPKSQQFKTKRALQEIWMAETKKDALAAFDALIETWGVKYDTAEHWKHLRTTNVIEARSRRSATARCVPRDVFPTRQRSP